MEGNFEKLIGGIVALIFGGIFSIFWRKIGNAMLAGQNTFWEKLGTEKAHVSIRNELFAQIFILVVGIMFLIAGAYMIYQFFKSY
ncbi:hypothetical protein M1N42_03540 [Thermodesulfovibrionales bacterium]|nr:hypothetical protein [Thermodesulfovibrionales bacterium]MCL0068796.1 hypothetical protein [Thermodesulfovibrionales bacterium]MCL0087001.1 hypothetical protein [Thermodesulfovibrionales bacterium]